MRVISSNDAFGKGALVRAIPLFGPLPEFHLEFGYGLVNGDFPILGELCIILTGKIGDSFGNARSFAGFGNVGTNRERSEKSRIPACLIRDLEGSHRVIAREV